MRVLHVYALVLSCSVLQAQISCNDNINFENGTTNNWTFTSEWAGNSLFFSSCCTQPGADVLITDNQNNTIMDPVISTFPLIPPGGGQYACRLGTCGLMLTFDQINRMQRSITVTATNYLFSFSTAIFLDRCTSVTETGNTACAIYFTRANGDTIPCSKEFYNSAMPQTLGSFTPLFGPGQPDTIFYRNWKTRTLDLSPYIGEVITAHFLAKGCSLGGHFGYMYVDAFCGDFQPQDSLCNSSSITFCAPAYYNTYNWTTPSGAHPSTQCINTNLPGTYTLKFPVERGCIADSLVSSYHLQNHLLGTAYHATPLNCSGDLVNFNYDNPQPTGNLWPCSLEWNMEGNSFPGTPGTTFQHQFAAPGTYSMELVVTACGGFCADTVQGSIQVNNTLHAAFTGTTDACANTTVSFTNTSVSVSPIVLNQWSQGTSTVSTVHASFAFPLSGTQQVQLIVEDSAGCRDTVVRSIQIHPYPELILSAQNVCLGSPVLLLATPLPSDTVEHWSWDADGNGSVDDTLQQMSFLYTQSGNYMAYVRAVGTGNCEAKDSIQVRVYPLPAPAFSMDAQAEPLYLFHNMATTPPPSVITAVSWDFGDEQNYLGLDPTVEHVYDQPGTYAVTQTVSNNFGCSMSYTKSMAVVSEYAIYVPNSFSPNGDQHNEVFRPEGFGIEDYELLIFDRWGNRLFKTNDFQTGWDGTVRNGAEPAQQDSYIWQISYRQPSGKQHQINGHVTIVR